MEFKIADTLDPHQKQQILSLWNTEYPAQIAYMHLEDLEAYLNKIEPATHFLAYDRDSIIAWASVFTREQERWFAIIVSSPFQSRGIGSQMLNILKNQESRLCGWVTDHDRYIRQDGLPYLSPLPFYLKNEFVICPDIRFESDKLSSVKILWQKSSQSDQ